MSKFFGHSENDSGRGCKEMLRDHLSLVARKAAESAEAFGANAEARTAGLLHDLGKYADQFQNRLANPSRHPGRDHWTAGAAAVQGLDRKLTGRNTAIALSILGHHTGLPSLPASTREFANDLAAVLKNRDVVTDSNVQILLQRWQADGLNASLLKPGRLLSEHDAVAMFDVRMLFSTLVDADFLETEAHFDGDASVPRRPRPDGPALDSDAAWQRLTDGMIEKRQGAQCTEEMQKIRTSLWDACQSAAQQDTGLFTLTAPTGSGKTLAMLGFALRHALEHDHIRRIVVVLPFLNIIEQTAQEYGWLFGRGTGFPDHTVLEDHSLAESVERPDEDNASQDAVEHATRTRRLLAENWDAPIVLTTHVKCLESLMAHRPGRCRKLHRLAGSVILFDEVQTLPAKLAVPTLATLSRLADPNGPYRSSVMFATATQPAFEHLNDRVKELNPAGWQPRPVVPDEALSDMFDVAARRVSITWRDDESLSIETLVDELASLSETQLLCIVNLKRHAAVVTESLRKKLRDHDADSVFHLSTSLCPAHRDRLLTEVRERLAPDSNAPCRLVGTQCVEAGVDLDFPVVYRAMAPLEAIAQAAGRCNRHGVRPEPGRVVVFNLDEGNGRIQFPPGYGEAVDVTRVHLNALRQQHGSLDGLEIINSPEILQRYFQRLYDLTGRGTGTRNDERDLLEAIHGGSFEKVAEHYRLISADTINVLVPYDRESFEELVSAMSEDNPRNPGMIRQWIQRARPHTVGIYRPKHESPVWAHLQPIQFNRRRAQENHEASWFHALPQAKYDETLGLQLPEENSWFV